MKTATSLISWPIVQRRRGWSHFSSAIDKGCVPSSKVNGSKLHISNKKIEFREVLFQAAISCLLNVKEHVNPRRPLVPEHCQHAPFLTLSVVRDQWVQAHERIKGTIMLRLFFIALEALEPVQNRASL
jgi:hypothetical protein